MGLMMPQSRQIVHERARWRRISARCPRIDLRMGRAANRSASKTRIASFRGGPYSPFLDNLGLLTLVAECPLMAISGHIGWMRFTSALPLKADIEIGAALRPLVTHLRHCWRFKARLQGVVFRMSPRRREARCRERLRSTTPRDPKLRRPQAPPILRLINQSAITITKSSTQATRPALMTVYVIDIALISSCIWHRANIP